MIFTRAAGFSPRGHPRRLKPAAQIGAMTGPVALSVWYTCSGEVVMEKHTDGPDKAAFLIEPTTPPRGGTPILRSLILLAVTTTALALFILGLGDLRRKHAALGKAGWYAAQLRDRVDGVTALPLNLRIEIPPGMRTRVYAVESLSPEHARLLRGSDQPVIVAQTVPIPRRFTSDGRAVVFFEAGRFDAKWLPLSRYDELAVAQLDEIRRRAASP